MGKMKKEDILANCIDEILAGKSTIEDCLARYPHLSDELRPLLKLALGIQPEEVTPSPEFKQRARKRLLEAMQPSVAPTEPRRLDIFGWLKPLARRTAVAIVVAALLVGGGATAYAAQGSMPDEVLYPMKIATEKVRLAVTPSEAGKAGLHIAFAERRVQEMAEMGRRGRVEEVTMLATALDYHLEQVKGLIEVVSAQGVDIYELGVRLEQSATQQLGVLEATLDEVPEEVKPSMVQALETSGEEYGTAIEVVASTAPTPMLVAGMGTIQIRATDPPPPEAVDGVVVQIAKIEVHLAGEPDSGWITIVDEPMSFDLMDLVGGKELDLGSNEVNAGTYTQVRMHITQATVIVGDISHDAFLPSERLKFVRPFKVQDGGTTVLLLDFDGQKSIHVTGAGQYMLKPVVTLLVPEIEVEAEEEAAERAREAEEAAAERAREAEEAAAERVREAEEEAERD